MASRDSKAAPASQTATSHSSTAPLAPQPLQSSSQPTFLDGLRSIHPADLAHVHRAPCARDSFLTGMGVGFGAGGLRFVLGGTPWTSMTYAIMSFTLASAGAHAFCQRKRQLEQASMAKAAEIVARKKEQRAKKAAEVREERRRRREEHDRDKGTWARMGRWFSDGKENSR